jgi:pimeloyl-ACP methyl ester carboxylesterase
LLFLGGWGAPTASYFVLFKELSNHFEVTAIDMLGMGCSGRPEYYAYDADSCIEFFMLQLEAWMAATKYDSAAGTPFHIMGHSMGCYFATHYTLRHPSKVDQLLFISPAGIYANGPDWTP